MQLGLLKPINKHSTKLAHNLSGNLSNFPADTETSQRRRKNVLFLVSKTS